MSGSPVNHSRIQAVEYVRRSRVTQLQGMLRHLAFFEELAGMDESDPVWRSVSAGLVTMRLIDSWIEEGPAALGKDSWRVNAVLSEIEQIPSTMPVRAILRSVVSTMVNTRMSDLHPVIPRLMA